MEEIHKRRQELLRKKQIAVAEANTKKGVVFALGALIVLVSTILLSLVVYFKTGKSVGDISSLTESLTVSITILLSIFTFLTFLTFVTGRSNVFRAFLNATFRLLGLLIGTSSFEIATRVEQSEPSEKQEQPRRSRGSQRPPASVMNLEHVRMLARMETHRELRRLSQAIQQKSEPNAIFNDIRARLQSFGTTILLRTFVNLAVGIGLSVFSIVNLFKTMETLAHTGQTNMLIYLAVVRVSVSVTVVLIAYFFLNLYKKGLEDLKYISDEITSIQLKHIALCNGFTDSLPVCQEDRQTLLNSDRHRLPNVNTAPGDNRNVLIDNLTEIIAVIAKKIKP